MFIPMDDHGFHRGDGVFEAVRIHAGAYYDLMAHLQRMENSAQKIGMTLPKSVAEIERICVELARRCAVPEGILRLFVTRGPGGFSPSTGEVIGHQIYAAITKLKPPTLEQYQNGVTAMLSSVDAKEAFWAQIKSCNYLQNVLMKKECLEKGVDFPVAVDRQGRVCEGATENLMIVSAEGELRVPRFEYTLCGTTVRNVMKLAEPLVTSGRLTGVRMADLTTEDLFRSREMAFVGTTLGVLPVRELDGRAIGMSGDICRFLHQSLMEQMSLDPGVRTSF